MEKHRILESNAPKVWDWLRTRGGLAIWGSVNLSNLDTSWTTPFQDAEGNPYTKPNWQASSVPARIITTADEVEVSIPKEVKRFHIAVRMGDQGFMMKVTDGGTRRIRAAVAKAQETYNKDSWYKFDYSTQEAVILIDDKVVSLTDWIKEHKDEEA